MSLKKLGKKMDEIRNKGRKNSGPTVENTRDVQEELEEEIDSETPSEENNEIDDRDKGHLKEPHAAKEAEHNADGHEPEDAEEGVKSPAKPHKKVKYHHRMNREGRPPIRIPVPNGAQDKRAQDNKF